MPLQPDSKLLYRASFDIEMLPEQGGTWKDIIKVIRKWLEQAPASRPPEVDEHFGKSWIYRGGNWRAPVPKPHFNVVDTVRFIGEGSEECPEAWALRYEHSGNDSEDIGRCFRTDISVMRSDDARFRVTINVSYFYRDGYFENGPSDVKPTVPGIVKKLHESKKWRCSAGGYTFDGKPRTVETGAGVKFVDLVFDAKRRIPVIYISRVKENGEILVDAVRLAHKVTGAALVFVAANADVDEEIKYLISDDLRAVNGVVRIYNPGLVRERQRVSSRHPFRTRADFAQFGSEELMLQMVKYVVRRHGPLTDDNIETIQDVRRYTRQREFQIRFAEIAHGAKGSGDYDELLALADGENKELHAQISSLQEALEREQRATEDERFAKELASEEVQQAKNQEAFWRDRSVKFEKDYFATRESLEQFAGVLATIPKTAEDCFEKIRTLFPDRIDFTERGRKALLDADLDVDTIWAGLMHMATTLYDLLFSEAADFTNLETDFFSRSGFEVAWREGRQTNRDNKLTRLRQDQTYNGIELDITPHVKFDRNKHRAYFDKIEIDGRQFLVIGDFGHLDTAGTGRIKS